MVNQPAWDSTSEELVKSSKTVEFHLQPLIDELNSLTLNAPTQDMANKIKGRSKRAHVLVETVCDAIEQFIRQGAEVAQDNPEMRDEIMQTIATLRSHGNQMAEASKDFANDPLSNTKRSHMVNTSRELLNCVGRILALADLIDVNFILRAVQIVQQDLSNLKSSNNQDELTHHFKNYGRDIIELTNQAGKRQLNIWDPKLRDELASARAILKKNSLKLLTASKTLIRHPELSAAQSNHDYVFKEVFEAVDKIHGISTNRISSENIKHLYDEAASLSAALDELDKQIVGIGGQNQFNESRMRLKLETQLENIISAVALMADSESTRPKRRDRIVNECNVLRQALQDLLNAYVNLNNRKCGVDQVDRATNDLTKLTHTVRRQLRKAVIDHISDAFLETFLPLDALITSAQHGVDEQSLTTHAQLFMDHVEKLLEVSSMACSMSNNIDGIKLVRMAAIQVQTLSPQVINAARILCARTSSKVALENMEVFRDSWQKSVRLLTDSVDDITTINDFLSVSENHILEDLNRCVMALRDSDPDILDRTAGVIRGRSVRVCNVVYAETDLYEPDEVINRIVDTVGVLKDQLLTNFARSVEYAVGALNSQQDPNDNGFIEASRLVYDGVHDVRNAVLMLYDNGYESDSDIEDYGEPAVSGSGSGGHSGNQEYGYNSGFDANWDGDAAVELKGEQFKNFTEEQKDQITKQLEIFRQEKKNFDREVLKWDDKGNDIIVLAKQMCVIMMEMTDFTRGRGPLKTTMDIINAAKKISECGVKLEKLARAIAEDCPESQSKRELDSYLKPIPLFCNQLNIASKVKANVIDVSGEPIITGLDSATSLIISAKNLMTAVVSVVKASYVASTKYNTKPDHLKPKVQWKMKAPEKKPLILTAKPQDIAARVRKASQKKKVEPLMELNEFQA